MQSAVADAVADAGVETAAPQGIAAEGVAEVPLERLEAQICSLASRLASATYQWLQLIAEFDLRKGWTGWGIKSCAHWLAWSCSVSPQAAREYLRVARTLEGLPLISAAFAAGRLSYSKVKAVTRVADLIPEATLLDQALGHTAAQLDRVVRAFRRTGNADTDRPAQRSARWFYDDDGTFVLTARLPAADGAVVLAALQLAEQTLESDTATPATDAAQPDTEAGAATPVVSGADALVAMADMVLAAGPVDNSGDDRHLVVLHIDADAAAEQAPAAGPGRCHLQDGPGLDRPTVERLICDAAVVAVAAASLGPGGTGEPLRLGRKTRKISPALRRALRIRDGGCQHPGCHRRRFLEAHHVRHWKDGGPTDLDNLILLCRFHHTLIHEQHFTITPEPHPAQPGWTFRRPDGTVIPAVRHLTADLSDTLATPLDQDSLGDQQRDDDADHAQGEGFRLAESVGVYCRATDPPAPPAEPFVNPLAWLDGGTPNDNDKRRDREKYAGLADEQIHAQLYPTKSELTAADITLATTDFDQFDSFDELVAFCQTTVYGTTTP